MSDEIIKESFTEEDIHKTIIEFCYEVLIPKNRTFCISKIEYFDKDDPNNVPIIKDYYLQVSSKDNDFLNSLPRTYRVVNKRILRIKIIPKYLSLLDYKKARSSKSCSSTFSVPSKEILIGGGGLSPDIPRLYRYTIGAFLKIKIKNSLNNDVLYYGLTSGHDLSYATEFYYSNGNSSRDLLLGQASIVNEDLDYGLIKVREDITNWVVEGVISNPDINNNILKKIKKGTPVSKYGIMTAKTSGKVHTDFACLYNAQLDLFTTGLIEIVHENEDCIFSDLGDSGSVIIDNKKRPLGIIKGGRELKRLKTSLVVPMCSIIEDIKKNYPNWEITFDI